jgi:RNA-directed DNA polymerase
MEKVAEEANLLEALRRVCANKGSAGVDGMDVTELKAWMSVRTHREKLRDKLISGAYEPAPVRDNSACRISAFWPRQGRVRQTV